MKGQDIIVYVLVASAVVFLLLKYLKPIIIGKKKDDCDNDCNCK